MNDLMETARKSLEQQRLKKSAGLQDQDEVLMIDELGTWMVVQRTGSQLIWRAATDTPSQL